MGRFENPSKLHIIPNFVDTDLYNPKNVIPLDEKLFPKTHALKLLYAGNIGLAQDWSPLVALVEKTKVLDVEYFVIGMGAQRQYLEEEKEKRRLEKLHILDYQPRHLMPSILAYSDVQFIFMAPEMEMMGFPSKVYTIMACERPLLICSGDKTPIVNFTKEHNCAKLITEKNFDKKVDEMVQWLASVSREELRQMGCNGYDVIQRYYTKEKVTKQYVDLVNKII